MHYLRANRQELQSFAVLCGGPILGGVLGGEGGRLHPRLWQNEIGELCQNATLLWGRRRALGNLLYRSTRKLLQFPNSQRSRCFRRRGAMTHFPHGAHRAACGGEGCVRECECECVCLYSERLSVKSKGPISHSIAAVLNSQHRLQSPILCDTMEVVTDNILEVTRGSVWGGF